MEFNFKKRQRIPASCSVCRKRKSKCDRVKPVCGSCKKKSIAHLCYYESENVEISPGSTGTLGHPQVSGPMKSNSPGDLHQQGQHPAHGVQSTYHFGSIGKQEVSNEGYIPGPSFGASGNAPNVPDRMYHPGTSVHQHNIRNPQGQHQMHHISQQQPHPLPQTHLSFHPNLSHPILTGPQQPPPPPPQQLHEKFPRNGYVSNYNPSPQNNFSNGTHPINIPNNENNTGNPEIFQPIDPHENLSNKENTKNLVTVSIGPNSKLQVNISDTIDVFSNASFSFLVEGSTWQQQGPLSYIGLTKSDPFLKFIRNYAISLFKSGDMSQFIKNKSFKRRKKSHNSADSTPTNPKNTDNNGKSNPKFETPASINSELSTDNLSAKTSDKGEDPISETHRKLRTALHHSFNHDVDTGVKRVEGEGEVDEEGEEEDDEEEEESDVVVEDGLIVSKIKVTDVNASDTDNNLKAYKALNILPGLKSLYQGNKGKHGYYDLVGKAIINTLPRKKNVFTLFCRFFKYVYPFVPILDENHFLMEINHILPEKFPKLSEDRYTTPEIKNNNDLVIFGLLLLVIRLGYMSLLHNNETHNGVNNDEKKMIEDMEKISAQEYINIVNLCIPEEQTSQKSSFKLIQSLTLLHFYRLVTPDDCHGLGGTDSQILFGTIIKHAFAIGLNRDPTKYMAHQNISNKPHLAKVWRSLWYYLVSVDASAAIHSGIVLNMQNLEVSDVQYPEYDSKTGKLSDTFRNSQAITDSYRSLCNLISNVKNKPKVVDVLAETNKMEMLFYNIFGKDFFKDCICQTAKPLLDVESPMENNMLSVQHEESFLKVMLYINFIQLRTNLSCMYYKIGIFYENAYSASQTSSMSAGIELFKIYIKSVIQLNYIMSYVVDNSVDIFGRNYDYILTAVNERCMIKTHAFLSSFFIRLLHHKKVLTEQKAKEHGNPNGITYLKLEVIEVLCKRVLLEAELYVGNFRKLSRKYINSYKLYVMTFFVLKQCMENPDVLFERSLKYSQFYHDGTNMIEFFTVADLQHLGKLCEEYKMAKNEQEKRKEASLSPDYARTYPTPMNAMGSSKNVNSDISDELSQTNSQNVPSSVGAMDFDPSLLNTMNSFAGLDNQHMQSEDLMRLFETYADSDQFDF